MKYEHLSGVPDFRATEYLPRRSDYALCIPIINEGNRIKRELDRGQHAGIDKIVDVII